MSRRPPTVAVLGGGSWGTTVASLAALNTQTTIWARDPETAREINESHTNSRYLDDLPLSPALRATSELAEAVAEETPRIAVERSAPVRVPARAERAPRRLLVHHDASLAERAVRFPEGWALSCLHEQRSPVRVCHSFCRKTPLCP